VKKLLALAALVSSVAAVAISTGGADARGTDCQPVTAVFYESSDWLRLAQGLAADASACANYYVTIPALAADKTQMVPNRAPVVRALGPNFHALAEINYTAWQKWVSANGTSWYAAGQVARQRMAAAGFDVSSGDTWVVNEISSAVRAGTGQARQNIRDLVRGLHDGDGSQPQVKGMVYVVGTGQNDVGFAQYKANLESWYQDQDFWADMTSYVSGFFQEDYGDVRNYAISGQDANARATLLDAYLMHPLALVDASGAPPTVATAKAFLDSTYGPLANASWGWSSNYGWTAVGSDVMADYISGQTYAMRLAGTPRLGFAWNPLNSQNLSATDYNAQIAGVLARLAGSIHETDAGDPTQACEATGCSAVVDGATPITTWSTFATWTPTNAVFTSPPATLTPGTPSNPITLQLQTGGAPTTLPVPVTLTVTSSSPTTQFSTTSTGPWSPTLTTTLAPGAVGAVLYAQDSTAGTPKFTASLDGQITTQLETVGTPAPAAPPPPPPGVRIVSAAFTPTHGRLRVSLQVSANTGQPLPARVSFTVLRDSKPFLSTVAQSNTAGQIDVTGFPRLELGCYAAHVKSVYAPGFVWDNASPAQTFCVKTLPARVGAVVFGRKQRHLHVAVRVVDDTGHPIAARVSYAVLHGKTLYASTAGATTSAGWLPMTAGKKLAKGCYSVKVKTIAAHGYAWDRVTGSNRYCVK